MRQIHKPLSGKSETKLFDAVIGAIFTNQAESSKPSNTILVEYDMVGNFDKKRVNITVYDGNGVILGRENNDKTPPDQKGKKYIEVTNEKFNQLKEGQIVLIQGIRRANNNCDCKVFSITKEADQIVFERVRKPCRDYKYTKDCGQQE